MEQQTLSPATFWSLRGLLRDIPVPEKYRPGLLKKQIDTVSSMVFVLLFANLLNVAVVLLSFRQSEAGSLLAIWGFCIIFITGLAALWHVRIRRANIRGHLAQAHVDAMSSAALIIGLSWAVAPLLVMHMADLQAQMVMAFVLTGMMFAGSFLLSRLPGAALSLMTPIGAGLGLSMLLQEGAAYQLITVLIVVYLGVLFFAVRWSHKLFVEQHLSEAAVKEQTQLIGLLLRDFEESTSDWLWQTDTAGTLEDIPLVIDTSSDTSSFMKVGAQLTLVFVAGKARKALEASLARHAGFRDIVLQVAGEREEECWISLTGKPIFEGPDFRGFRGVAADITQSKQIEDRMTYMAHYDGLTGLPNRATLQDYLEKVIRKPQAPNTVRALLWLDLDNFKWVNDTLGHPAGDELLRQVSARLKEMTEKNDHLARLGGDEFALLIERPSGGVLEAFFNRLTEHMRKPYDIWGSTAHCSASFGVRVFDTYTTDTREVLKHADLALYEAKRTGKAQWSMFTNELQATALARVQIEAELERAIDNDELRIYFQPIVDARTHKVLGVESLLRWQHPSRGLVFPEEFIELAEDNGLITRMGEWVIRAALAEAARLPETIKVAINISPLQIHSTTLVSTIVNALATHNIPPNRLELEITESVLMTDTEFTLKRLHQIKDLGVRISLDDFGTGYSSLSYLRAFPFDKIKIDKSFVNDIESRPESRAIAMATLSLAKSLGMRCTAEGVETLYQADFLREQGCDELQGFFISRAQPLDYLTHIFDVRRRPECETADVQSIEAPGEVNVVPFTSEKRA
ncbi:MAG: EAL domain-containing protein [Hyphomonas sp.]|uniref:putative bifunctional diguanylate cyclase/phosphodiesterase n=1 Tax=Hyphomonas sp. TaxID=87 RepID=UPI0034A097BD